MTIKIETDYTRYRNTMNRKDDWCAVFEGYDGAPDSDCTIGTGVSEIAAMIDLLQYDCSEQHEYINIDIMHSHSEHITASPEVALERLEYLVAKDEQMKRDAYIEDNYERRRA